MQLDLASLLSVRTFAENFLRSESRLDLLINNAGQNSAGVQGSDQRGFGGEGDGLFLQVSSETARRTTASA